MYETINQTTPLPFDPNSQVKDSMVVNVTPQMAEYILTYHNTDNRKLCPSQV